MKFRIDPALRFGIALFCLFGGEFIAHQSEHTSFVRDYTVALFSSMSNTEHRSFLRIINHSPTIGEITIVAYDDDGNPYGPLSLNLESNAAVLLNSTDLEQGNSKLGIRGSTGSGNGDWHLVISSELDLDVLSYLQSGENFLVSAHDTSLIETQRHQLAIFEPGNASNLASTLRVTNFSSEAASVKITGIDDLGHAHGPGAIVEIPPLGARTYTATELESGASSDIRGYLGDGVGRWRLTLESNQHITALNLLESATGPISNLSSPPILANDGMYAVPLFPSVSDEQRTRGFVRIINLSDRTGTINIQPYDDSDYKFEALSLSISGKEAKHLHSEDLEFGNPSLGLNGSTGAGTGTWRLNISSDLPIQVLAYLESSDGFYTPMHETVFERGNEHQVVTFSPALHSAGLSFLRLVNQSDEIGIIVINAFDDAGRKLDRSFRVELPPMSATNLSRDDLLTGVREDRGELGSVEGMLRLSIVSTTKIQVMNLSVDETGRFSNLSATPASHFAPTDDAAFRKHLPDGWSVFDETGIDLSVNNGRFRTYESILPRGGEWNYTQISRNQARIELTFDDGDQCALYLQYTSTTSFYHSHTCGTSAPDGVVQYSRTPSISSAELPTPFQLDAANSDAVGIANSNGLLYVPDSNGHVYVYTTNGERREEAEFDLDSDNSDPHGIVYANGHLYIVDGMDAQVYVYRITGEPNSDLDFELVGDRPEGITYANNRLYIVDQLGGVFTYLLTGERDAGRDFRPVSANQSPRGITFANDRLYVVDWLREKVFAYTVQGTHTEEFDFALNPDASRASGITYDGQWFFVVHDSLNQIWAYSGDERPPDGPDLTAELADSMPLEVSPAGTFELSVIVRNVGTNSSPESVLRFYESEKITITEDATEIATQEFATLEPDQSRAFTITVSAPEAPGFYYYGGCADLVSDEVDEQNNCSFALHVTVNESNTLPASDGLLANVTRLEYDLGLAQRYHGLASTEDALYALVGGFSFDVHGYDASGTRNTSADFQLDLDNANPDRIAVANDKLYVIDEEDNRVYGYDLEGNRFPSIDFDLDANHVDPDGLTFGEDTFYVVDELYAPARVFVYSIEGERIPSADFDLHEDNRGAVGIAYANGRLFVVDTSEHGVFAYSISGERLHAFDFALDSAHSSPVALTYRDGSFFVGGSEAIYVYSFDDDAGISAPDLASTIPHVDRSVGPERMVDLRVTVTNRGDQPSVESTLRFYQSTDTVIDSTDIELGSYAVAPLDPKSRSDFTFEFESSAQLGTYYYGACVDVLTEEALATNNCSASERVIVTERGGPDLSVLSMRPRQQLWTRHPFSISAFVRNRGDAETDESTLRFYRSNDAEISIDDIEVAQMALNPLSPGIERRFETTLFSPGEPGTHFYGVCVDSVSGESNIVNNCGAAIEVSTSMQVCSFNLDEDHESPKGIAHASDTLYVPNAGFEQKVFTYSIGGTRLADTDFALSATVNRSPHRAAFGNDVMYVLDSRVDKVFGYSISGERVATADFDLESDANEGITFADGNLFFVDADRSSLRAYTLTGERVPAADFDLDPYNSDPVGVEFVDALFYVVDRRDQKVYAYDRSGTRAPERDFALDESNVNPAGDTFDGTRFHVVDGSGNRVYAYPFSNDAANAEPCFREGLQASRAMFENTPPGINVGDPVQVNGIESPRYILTGRDASQFEIVESTGQIRTVAGVVYDFESTEEYELEVGVNYEDNLLDTIEVAIEVYDESSSCFFDSDLSPRIVAGDGRLSFYWTLLSDYEGFASIVGYETEIKPQITDEWADRRTFFTTSTGHAFYTGLENGLEYDIRLRSINAENDCPWLVQISGIPTPDFAPRDEREFVDRFGPYPIGSTDRNFRLLAPGRCRHTTDGASLDANCTYEKTASEAASILLEFDDPSKGSCSVSLAYSSPSAGSFIDECFDAGVNTDVDFDTGIRMPTDDSDGLPNTPIPRSPRSQEEFDVFVWGRADLIPGLGFGCPPVFESCEFAPGNGYLIGRDDATRLPVWTLGEYEYENTGPRSGRLTFRVGDAASYEIELEFESSGHIRTTISETSDTDFGWPGMPHLDLELGAQTILLPVPPSWEAAIAVETDFSNNVDENVVFSRLLETFFPDLVELVGGYQGLRFHQTYMKVGRNRAVQTFEFPHRSDWLFNGLPEEERARKHFLNGSKWTIFLDFNSDGSAFITFTYENDGYWTSTSSGFIDFLDEDASLEAFPDEIQLPDEAPQEPGEDIADVIAAATAISEINSDTFQTMVISASDVEFNPGDWLEPKDGGNQRMMVVASDQSAPAKPSIVREFTDSRVKQRFDFLPPSMATDHAVVRRPAASISPHSQVSSDLVRLKVVCMQFDQDLPSRGARYFSKPKVASDEVQSCQQECVLAGGEGIQGCVWDCE